ncbi:MAG TPA: TetR/AcrR family transcriptional regulator C-terminal domain-containing protein [Jatrophihabitantaceae bacterium]
MTHNPVHTALWERELPASRNRSTRLTPGEVAQAAFLIAESESLWGTSVKRVANRLGVPALRLEHYLASREDLFDLMLDQALAEIDLPEHNPELGWRPQLRELADATYALACRHPWLVELIARPPSGPNGLRFLEQALACFDGSGLDVRSAALAFNAVLAFVCGSVRVDTRSSAARRLGTARDEADYLNDAVAAPSFPHLAALFDDATDVTLDRSFTQGLDYLLDGIAERIAGGIERHRDAED